MRLMDQAFWVELYVVLFVAGAEVAVLFAISLT